MAKNIELARKARELTRIHNEWFDMDTWCDGELDALDAQPITIDMFESGELPCGTTACYAGWVVLAAGYGLDGWGNVYRYGVRQTDSDGDTLHASGKAMELLGIDVAEASRLFYSDKEFLDADLASVFGEPF